MPPRSAKKAAAAKKPSPRPKKVATPAVDPVPIVKVEAQEDAVTPSAAAPTVIVEQQKEEVVVVVTKTESIVTEVTASVEQENQEAVTDEKIQESVEEDPVEEDPVEEEEKAAMEVEDQGNKQIDGGETGGDIENTNEVGVDGVDNVEGVEGLSDDDNGSDSEAEDEENNEDDPTLYAQASLAEKKKQDFELYIGGLDKGAVEEDLTKVFGVFGEIQSVRIVKHPSTQKSKGFAFIRYVSVENAEKALAEFKDGTEVKGKQIRVSASQDNDTLYLGNICKTWTKDKVIETLKVYGIEQIEDILVPNDEKNEGKIKGFALLEFSSHSEAMAACQRLRKPDAVFGRDVSARVGFASTPLHPSEEALSQVKTVFVEAIPKSWDEAKVKELCKQYGEIEKIRLSRDFSTRRKDFGFIDFTSRDSAVACVEGINTAQFGEDVKVKANLAKPMRKGRLSKNFARGGFKVKDGEASEADGQSKKNKKAKSKVVESKEETQSKLKSSNGSKQSVSENKDSERRKVPQTAQSAKGKKRDRKGIDTATNRQPSKKMRNNRDYGKAPHRPCAGFGNRRPSAGFDNQRNTHASNLYMPPQIVYAPRYAAPPATYYPSHAYAGTSGSQRHHSDLAPHAGYLPPAKQVQNPYDYELRRVGAYDNQPRSSGYAGALTPQTAYPGRSSYSGYEAGYAYLSSEAYVAPRRGYY